MKSTSKTKIPNYAKDTYKQGENKSILHNFENIKWLRTRVSPLLIEQNINRIIPPFEELIEDHKNEKHKKLQKFLEESKKANEKPFRYFNPRNFFSSKTFEKILKLKQIFLEFDVDGSRKLEIDEIEEMFRTNNMNVNMDDLVGLFFKNKKISKNEKPYLDFYKFMEFAISNECDQHYRNFMRDIRHKDKIRKIIMKDIIEYFGDEFKNNNNQTKQEKSNFFLPMNFNLVLDYFNNKGKDRELIKKINKTISKIENYMKSENFLDESEKKIFESKNLESFNMNSTNLNENKGKHDLTEEDIQIKQTLENFDELLKPKVKLQIKKNSTQQVFDLNDKAKGQINLNKTNSAENYFKKIRPEDSKNYFTDYYKRKIQENSINSSKFNSTQNKSDKSENHLKIKAEDRFKKTSIKLVKYPLLNISESCPKFEQKSVNATKSQNDSLYSKKSFIEKKTRIENSNPNHLKRNVLNIPLNCDRKYLNESVPLSLLETISGGYTSRETYNRSSLKESIIQLTEKNRRNESK